ncbi:outer membrane lipoprotein-sorting protein [Pseudomonadota bacterium]
MGARNLLLLKPSVVGALLVALFSPPSLSWAETAEEKGLAIATEGERRQDGFGDFSVEMKMVLRNRQGQESIRYTRLSNLEVDGDGDKSLSIFDEPADVKGTAMLTYTHKSETDEQWLYLPALKRVKRIASRNKSGPYMGSEFAYEDITSQEVEKYTYKYLRDETLDGMDCFVVERDPVDKYSGYTRQVLWIDKDKYRPRKIDFYDRKNSLLKTLYQRDYQKFLEDHWRPGEMYMENHQNGKTTTIYWSNYKFQTGLTEKDFRVADLKRAK